MKKFSVIFFCFLSFSVFAQRNSEKIIPETKYGSHTEWSPIDKHYAYYFVNYAMPIAFEQSIENSPKSGNLDIGISYRYKIAKVFDIGAEASYDLRFSNIKKTSFNNFDTLVYFNPKKIYTNSNAIAASLFFRFNIKYATHRQLGLFVDIGAFYSYSIGNLLVFKTNDAEKYQKIKIKKASFLDDNSFGSFLRFGYNYISLYCKYDFSNWIVNYGKEKNIFLRPPFLLGIQLNLYAK